MDINSDKRVLFLCTGNYYRSRFAEEYFNHISKKKNLGHIASSRGLARNIDKFRNPGPISPNTEKALLSLGIEGQDMKRFPESLDPSILPEYSWIIALNRVEHEPMVETTIPSQASFPITYWNIKDIDEEDPIKATNEIKGQIDSIFNHYLTL